LEPKYTTTPNHDGASNQESLLERIFINVNVNEDLKGSGTTGFYP
jgi:hypothetical protein